MARWGRVDYEELKKLQKNIEELTETLNMDAFCESCAKELAARLLALVIPKTPVGDYSGNSYTCANGQTHKGHKVTGKVGGTLRRGWTSETHGEAEGGSGKGKNAKEYANSLNITKSGNTYTIEIVNPVEYASYVEFGHRTVNGGWVEGHYMLTISEEKLKSIAPQVLEKKLNDYLKGVF